jgi:hypothetical protein
VNDGDDEGYHGGGEGIVVVAGVVADFFGDGEDKDRGDATAWASLA